MRHIIRNQKGAVIVIFALVLIVLLGFAGLGIESGRWYLTRAELAKAVDAAALAGAANISNPNINVVQLARDFGMENFQPGYLGTPQTGSRSVSFDVTTQQGGILSVRGRTDAVAILARLFDIEFVATAATGVAQKNRVEIIMVLDRSGSMSGTPISDLKDAARGFLEYYEDTQEEDRIGLVSFATGVRVDFQLNNYYYNTIRSAINALSATGATNIEDALGQAGAQFADQTPVAPANRVQQYIVFFTDGRPTAFRSTFRRNGTNYDAVVCSTGNCDSNSDSMYAQMGYPDREQWYNTSTLSPEPTGDGLTTATTACPNAGSPPRKYVNTRWGSFSAYPVSGLGVENYPPYCGMGDTGSSTLGVTDRTRLNGRNGYICTTARQMAIDHVNSLKARFVKVYAVGLGNVDSAFLNAVASGSDYVYITPNSSELEAIFRRIAQTIKLRLVQ
jgi:uncharacterized protein YegL